MRSVGLREPKVGPETVVINGGFLSIYMAENKWVNGGYFTPIK